MSEVNHEGYGACLGFGFNCTNLFGKWRRQNTRYADDESNWACLCEECQIDTDAHWRDMWADYYSMIREDDNATTESEE